MLLQCHFQYKANVNYGSCHTALAKLLFIGYLVLPVQKQYPKFFVIKVSHQRTQIISYIAAAGYLIHFEGR